MSYLFRRGFCIVDICTLCVSFVCWTTSTSWAIHYRVKMREGEQQTNDIPGSGDERFSKQDNIFNNTALELSKMASTDTDRIAGGLQCGTTRVVGGRLTEAHWPWQAELHVKKTGRHLCGGTLIDSEHVLTAAHCFDSYDTDEVMVTLGSRSRTLQASGVQTYPIACSHVHKRYRRGANYDYDIALLKLKTAAAEATPARGVLLDEHMAPACLPRRREFGADTKCVVTGWGYTSFRSLLLGRLPSRLREATVPLISAKTCRDAYGSTLTSRMVCAGHMRGERRPDTCKGDSGGPLVCQSGDRRWKIWGVTSWGGNQFCSQSPTDPAPGVYTRVDKFVNWIEKKMSVERCAN